MNATLRRVRHELDLIAEEAESVGSLVLAQRIDALNTQLGTKTVEISLLTATPSEILRSLCSVPESPVFLTVSGATLRVTWQENS